MLEIPEAATIARQAQETILGRTIVHAVAGQSPHGFAFYTGDPALYGDMLKGKPLTSAKAYGGHVELEAGDCVLSFHDGVNLRYVAPGEKRPEKHQLLLELADQSALVCTVQMYAGLLCFPKGTPQNFYYDVAREKPSPLTDAFDEAYFASLLTDAAKKLSAKAFLATEQRIPGLGNGALQDILWTAKVHPKRKMSTLSDGETAALFHAVKGVLLAMAAQGGRDTEKDLFGHAGGYRTVMSKHNEAGLCPHCGGPVKRMSYLGGNVYVCQGCQR